jgi:peptide subunit release factor 1 (eRF1)
MTATTWSDVQPLLDQFKGDGLMVSCYADLTVERGFQSHWSGPFKSKADTIKETLRDDQRAWQACMQDLHSIESVLRGSEARQAHGMAVFSAQERGFFRALPLDVPVKNELVIHQAPYLVPLLEALHRQRDYLVVHTDTHRGRLYAAHPGAVQLLQEVEEAVPKRQHSAGECWGTQQATIARHREDRILHYQKELVRSTEATWAKLPFRGLILLGEHEVLEHVRARLPRRLQAHIIFEAPHPWTETVLQDDATIGGLLADALKAHEKRVLDEVKDRLHQGYAVAAGPRQVVEALQNGRVGPRGYGYLVLGPDLHKAIACCTACRFLSVDMPSTCPRCQSPCIEGNLWEELLLLTLRHEIAVHFVGVDAELQAHGGAVAVLPKDHKKKP